MANNVKKPGSSFGRNRCCFTGCSRTKIKCPTLHFFKFPVSRVEICDKWILNCANEAIIDLPKETLKYRVVCEKHFSKDSFTSTIKNRLNSCGVPTIYCEDEEDQTTVNDVLPVRRALFSSPNTSSTNKNNDSIITPEYKKLKSVKGRKKTPMKFTTPTKPKLLSKLNLALKKIKFYKQKLQRISLKKKEISLSEIVDALKEYLPLEVLKFVEMQINHGKGVKNKPYNKEEKRQALLFRYRSAALYEEMRSKGFALPSRSTITRWLGDIQLQPGICRDLFDQIRIKIETMSSIEKQAVLLFDGMIIKKHLSYDSKEDLVEGVKDLGFLGRGSSFGTEIILFMARGLTHKWKIPVAYYVVNSEVVGTVLKEMITECVSNLIEVGLKIRAVVCDQGSTHRNAATLLGTSKDVPYFSCRNEKIYFIYDFPHIIKCLRNNLMKRDKSGQLIGQINTADGIVDWAHVVDLYKIDRMATTARATKLTDKHILPNNFEKMSVKLATQVFSHSVSSAMKVAVEEKQLPPEATTSADVIKRLNNLFDVMNSKQKFDKNPYRCGISSSTDAHLGKPLKTLIEDVEWSRSFEMVNVKTNPPSFDCLTHTLNAVLLLWKDLEVEGVSFLLTSRLNQDPLENEFSIARRRGGNDRNPSAKSFKDNLRHRILSILIKPSPGANCEPDDDELLVLQNTQVKTHYSSEGILGKTGETYNEIDINYESDDDEDGELQDSLIGLNLTRSSLEACAVRYFAGYAVRSCMKKFPNCLHCKRDLLKNPDDCEHDPDESLIINKSYNERLQQQGWDIIREKHIGLHTPSEDTTRVAKLVLDVFHKNFAKNIHQIGLLKMLILKSKRIISLQQNNWLINDECKGHKHYFIKKLLTTKLKWKLKEISADMRQPANRSSKSVCKIKILKNV